MAFWLSAHLVQPSALQGNFILVIIRSLHNVAVAHLKLAQYKQPKKQYDWQTKDDAWKDHKEYWSKGITSAINAILTGFDNKAVSVAVLCWALQRQRFSGQVSKEAEALIKELPKELKEMQK